VVDSGDAVADQSSREWFVNAYEAKHTLAPGTDGSMILCVGDGDWPFPLPLVKSTDPAGWYFDTKAGEQEMINRRVGRNELNTIQTCLAVVDAQREFALGDADGNGYEDYAQYFLSSPGKRDGLYWPTAPNEPPSPLGGLVSEAAEEGYSTTRSENNEPRPYHGYLYRILRAQGPAAPGGAMSYVVNGKMLAGFAVVAWPAEYGNSGVMTFIAGADGVVYEQDMGGSDGGKAMSVFNPVPGWVKSDTTPPPQ